MADPVRTNSYFSVLRVKREKAVTGESSSGGEGLYKICLYNKESGQ